MSMCSKCGLAIDNGVTQCRRCGAEVSVSTVAAVLPVVAPAPDVPVYPAPPASDVAVFPAAPPAPDVSWLADLGRIGPITPIRNLGNALGVLLMITAGTMLLWVALPDIDLLPMTLSLACAIVTIVWLYRARMNVEGLAHQRRAKGWVIGGWFCPVVNLWFPFQIVEDIAKVDKPARRAHADYPIRFAWWVCWLLSWITGLRYTQTRTVHADGSWQNSFSVSFNFGGNVVSRLLGAAAAILLAIIVREISTRQEQRSRG